MDERFEVLKQYNPWDGNIISTGFTRDFYTSKIEQYVGNPLVKVLTGQRRAGKSYILRQIAMGLIEKGIRPENILFINLEFTAFDFLRTGSDLDSLIYLYRESIRPKGRVYIFIDEIQNIAGWEKTVNSLSQDYAHESEVFISGSNSSMLSGELASHLSGRYVEFEILPLSYDEWAAARSVPQGRSGYLSYLTEGGLPELLHLGSDEVRRHYVSSLKDTILLRDIIARYQIRDTRMLEDLFVYTVNNATKLATPNTIVKFYKGKGKRVSYDMVASYLSYMAETFLIHKVERYNVQGKETIAGNCKYYINDLAFYNYLYKGFAYGFGYELENLVYLDLRRAGYDVYVGSVHDSRTGEQKEVDFVGIKGDRKIYVQATYELKDEITVAREYGSLELIGDNYPKFVVSMDEASLPNKDGIKHVHAWKFGRLLSEG
ncbi:MAG: ATP-binding protein [Candidatus Cryptobacteroides sp.]